MPRSRVLPPVLHSAQVVAMAQYAHLSVPDPEWAELSARLPSSELPSVESLLSIQAYAETIPVSTEVGDTDYLRILETKILSEDNEIRAKAYIPRAKEAEAQGYPLLIWMYGGGWVYGTIEDDEPLLKSLAADLKITCVCGDYRKIPQHPYPAAVNDSYAVFKWAVDHASELSVDISKGVIVGGISAGANLAAVVAQRASKDSEYKHVVTGQSLVVPVTISPHAYPDKFKSELLSGDEDADKRLPKTHRLALSQLYHGKDNAANPEVSPALAESFEGLPPTYIQISGLDPLRDEGFLYERLLREAGIPTKVDVYPGLPHGFHVNYPTLAATKKQNADFIQGLEWLLQLNNKTDRD